METHSADGRTVLCCARSIVCGKIAYSLFHPPIKPSLHAGPGPEGPGGGEALLPEAPGRGHVLPPRRRPHLALLGRHHQVGRCLHACGPGCLPCLHAWLPAWLPACLTCSMCVYFFWVVGGGQIVLFGGDDGQPQSSLSHPPTPPHETDGAVLTWARCGRRAPRRTRRSSAPTPSGE